MFTLKQEKIYKYKLKTLVTLYCVDQFLRTALLFNKTSELLQNTDDVALMVKRHQSKSNCNLGYFPQQVLKFLRLLDHAVDSDPFLSLNSRQVCVQLV